MRQTPHLDADDPSTGSHADEVDEDRLMTPEQVKARFDELASYLGKAYEELGSMTALPTRQDDQRAVESIRTDLVWAMENCTVIGLHQIGKALDDDMGHGSYDDSDLY